MAHRTQTHGAKKHFMIWTAIGRPFDIRWLFCGVRQTNWHGLCQPDLAVPGTKLQVKMLRELWNAEITVDSPYDPKNEKIRIDG